jgi:hypothetical protein
MKNTSDNKNGDKKLSVTGSGTVQTKGGFTYSADEKKALDEYLAQLKGVSNVPTSSSGVNSNNTGFLNNPNVVKSEVKKNSIFDNNPILNNSSVKLENKQGTVNKINTQSTPITTASTIKTSSSSNVPVVSSTQTVTINNTFTTDRKIIVTDNKAELEKSVNNQINKIVDYTMDSMTDNEKGDVTNVYTNDLKKVGTVNLNCNYSTNPADKKVSVESNKIFNLNKNIIDNSSININNIKITNQPINNTSTIQYNQTTKSTLITSTIKTPPSNHSNPTVQSTPTQSTPITTASTIKTSSSSNVPVVSSTQTVTINNSFTTDRKIIVTDNNAELEKSVNSQINKIVDYTMDSMTDNEKGDVTNVYTNDLKKVGTVNANSNYSTNPADKKVSVTVENKEILNSKAHKIEEVKKDVIVNTQVNKVEVSKEPPKTIVEEKKNSVLKNLEIFNKNIKVENKPQPIKSEINRHIVKDTVNVNKTDTIKIENKKLQEKNITQEIKESPKVEEKKITQEIKEAPKVEEEKITQEIKETSKVEEKKLTQEIKETPKVEEIKVETNNFIVQKDSSKIIVEQKKLERVEQTNIEIKEQTTIPMSLSTIKLEVPQVADQNNEKRKSMQDMAEKLQMKMENKVTVKSNPTPVVESNQESKY